jgi:hypothetical protein
MPLTPEQVEQEIERLGKAYRELSERVTHLQRRVAELEKGLLEEALEYEEPED